MKEQILKEFDKKFGKEGFYVETSIDCNNNYTNTEIKQFISQAIDKTIEKTREEVRAEIQDLANYVPPNLLLNEIINKI